MQRYGRMIKKYFWRCFLTSSKTRETNESYDKERKRKGGASARKNKKDSSRGEKERQKETRTTREVQRDQEELGRSVNFASDTKTPTSVSQEEEEEEKVEGYRRSFRPQPPPPLRWDQVSRKEKRRNRTKGRVRGTASTASETNRKVYSKSALKTYFKETTKVNLVRKCVINCNHEWCLGCPVILWDIK